MARPKKNAEDKKQAQQVPQVAPQPPQQHMMPQGTAPQAMAYQNMAPQMAMPQMPQQQMPRQPQHQFQQFAPQVQMPQQPPPPQMPQQPIPMPQQQNISGRFVDGESFLSVRDSTLTRLTTISALLESLAKDYLRHTSLLLGDTSEANQEELLNNFKAAAAQAAQAMHINTDAPPPAAHVEEKKERKKRTHDPNAPKRPLTPYFLYMQHARGIISSDLGADAPKGAVQEEGQRRWGSMGVDEKKGWNQAYQYNLRLYNARTASYKAGNLDAKNMTDDEALEYANSHAIREVPQDGDVNVVPFMGDPNDNDAIAQQLQGGVEPALAMPTPASKTPKKAAGGRKRKSEAADDSKAATPAAASAAASPAKRRRSTKAAAADTPTAEETKPKGRGGKKTKSS